MTTLPTIKACEHPHPFGNNARDWRINARERGLPVLTGARSFRAFQFQSEGAFSI
jgi:hypothetical protein